MICGCSTWPILNGLVKVLESLLLLPLCQSQRLQRLYLLLLLQVAYLFLQPLQLCTTYVRQTLLHLAQRLLLLQQLQLLLLIEQRAVGSEWVVRRQELGCCSIVGGDSRWQ